MNRNNVVLVDQSDVEMGTMDKLAAHEQGHLHRAFSIFIFNDKGQLLLQRRSYDKYHGGGLWTNTCCSHPQMNEIVLESAKKRLKFEMGIDCDLEWVYSFIYKEKVENDLIEHEFDHVFKGFSNDIPVPNLDEVSDYKWMNVSDISNDIAQNPRHYTVWFRQALPELIKIMKIKHAKLDGEII